MSDSEDCYYLPPILSNTEYPDICIYTRDGSVAAHKLVLASISDYLRTMLLDISEENVGIILPDYNTTQVEILLSSIYQFQKPDENVAHLMKTLACDPLKSDNLVSKEVITPKSFKGRKKTSIVWDHFLQDSEHRTQAVCQYCYKTIVANKGSTSSMLKHLVLYHSDKLQATLPEDYKISDTIETENIKKTSDYQYNISADGLQCMDCGKHFSSKCSSRSHWRSVHSGVKLFSCSQCSKDFARKSCYLEHVASHSDSKVFVCSECGKTFSRRHTRDIHERIHKQDFRFPCSYCDKKFINNFQLTTHERIHSGEKPFICNVCNKGFSQKHHLVTHTRIHTGITPYQCSLCGKSFKYLSSKTSHVCIKQK